MTLAAGEQRALAKIEEVLRRSDPKLAAMLSTFNRLARSEEMPRREFLSAPGRLRWRSARTRARSARAGARSARAGARSGHPRNTSRLPSQGGYPNASRLTSPSRYRRVPRIAAILSVAIAVGALGLMVVLFSAINHVRPAGATPGPASTCRYVMKAGCQPVVPSPHKR
jgi:hypothetical protein